MHQDEPLRQAFEAGTGPSEPSKSPQFADPELCQISRIRTGSSALRLGGPRKKISDKIIKKMIEMRLKGHSLKVVAKHFGVSITAVAKYTDPRGGYNASAGPIGKNSRTEADANRLMRQIPEDTRSLTGRICGDPLPGRSALDKVT